MTNCRKFHRVAVSVAVVPLQIIPSLFANPELSAFVIEADGNALTVTMVATDAAL